MYAIVPGCDLYAMELEVRVANGNEAQAGDTRMNCLWPPASSSPPTCSTVTCSSGWVDRPGKAQITCQGVWCEIKECCKPPATQPIVVEMKSLKKRTGFSGTGADVQT